MIVKHFHDHFINPTYKSGGDKSSKNSFIPGGGEDDQESDKQHAKSDIGPAAIVCIEGPLEEDPTIIYDEFGKKKSIDRRGRKKNV